jgi:hypothetical protein
MVGTGPYHERSRLIQEPGPARVAGGRLTVLASNRSARFNRTTLTMATRHPWLFPPARPLVERLGPGYFRAVPARPGVYSMRDASGTVVYVGKAKNLRRRLGSYRVANPERVSRRQLRLLREVARIDFELCGSESEALALEGRLLRRLKPRFNRAGLWPGRTRFLTWRFSGQTLEFALQDIPAPGWERFGPMGGRRARSLYGALLRLLWLGVTPNAGFGRLPHGWSRARFAWPVTLPCHEQTAHIRRALDHLFWGQPAEFLAWIRVNTDGGSDPPAFHRVAVQTDLDEITSFVGRYRNGNETATSQLALL